MNRRTLVQGSAVSALAALAAAANAATKAPAKPAAADHSHHSHGANKHQALIDSSVACLSTGESCVAHCLVVLGQGETEMAACAQSVSELLAVCDALYKLAIQGSNHLPALAKVAAGVCEECEKECRKHEKKHAECKACGDACAECVKQCKAVKA
ncbi:four-helix bundle copper-binding protein [Ideonella sp. A 288]|uniref:four-helix bundle copper-binding protein n=1 Tax=Ideonella sp. A 288 TaxID=1962181 RepID=UPI000B4BF93C|nr:four-helix bundle copper-binding protein [Ideonella sp. A 288]